jgi:hypothetical protein
MLLSLLSLSLKIKGGLSEPFAVYVSTESWNKRALAKQHLNTFPEQQARTHARAQTHTHTMIEELLCMVVSMHSVSYQILNMQ